MWLCDTEMGIEKREVTYVPGLYKIVDEILMFVADNKVDSIKIDINQEENTISLMSTGKGMEVEWHNAEEKYLPSIIFGQLSTVSTSDDAEAMRTAEQSWFGAKLCNIFSKEFVVETTSNGKTFTQTWRLNMSETSGAVVNDIVLGEEFTRVTFQPDLGRLGVNKLDSDFVAFVNRRAYDLAATLGGVNVFLNEEKIPVNSFKDYVHLHVNSEFDDAGDALKVVHDHCGER